MQNEYKDSLIKIALDSTNNWIGLADKKAGFFLTIYLALFSSSLLYIDNLLIFCKNIFFDTDYIYILSSLALVSLFLLYSYISLRGIYILIKVIKPKTKASSENKSLIYFESLKELEDGQIESEYQKINEESYMKELANQISINSSIASKKYANLKDAINCLLGSVFFGLLIILLYILLNIL